MESAAHLSSFVTSAWSQSLFSFPSPVVFFPPLPFIFFWNHVNTGCSPPGECFWAQFPNLVPLSSWPLTASGLVSPFCSFFSLFNLCGIPGRCLLVFPPLYWPEPPGFIFLSEWHPCRSFLDFPGYFPFSLAFWVCLTGAFSVNITPPKVVIWPPGFQGCSCL